VALIADFRKQREHAPIHINGTAVESAGFKFLSVHITVDLTWTNTTTTLVKRKQQRRYFLRRLKKFCMRPGSSPNTIAAPLRVP
jgi:hypothetical protein